MKGTNRIVKQKCDLALRSIKILMIKRHLDVIDHQILLMRNYSGLKYQKEFHFLKCEECNMKIEVPKILRTTKITCPVCAMKFCHTTCGCSLCLKKHMIDEHFGNVCIACNCYIKNSDANYLGKHIDKCKKFKCLRTKASLIEKKTKYEQVCQSKKIQILVK